MTYQPAYSRGGAWSERSHAQVLAPVLARTHVDKVLHSPESLRTAVEQQAQRSSRVRGAQR